MKERNNVNSTKKLLQEYQNYLQDEERSRATVEKYLRDVKHFLRYLGDSREIDKEIVREYKQDLIKHYKITSANSMLAALNSYFCFLGKQEWKVKLFKIQKVSYMRPEREMTGKDYEKLVQTAHRTGDERMSMLLQTIGSTGIRISELRFITVESLRTGRAEIYNKGKSRLVLLPRELSRLLTKYCKKAAILTGSIFVTKHGNPVDRSNISKKMKQLAGEAGVDEAKVFPHNLRHLFARTFYNLEKDVIRLMDLLGHNSINTTRIYTMVTEDQPRRQMSRMKMVLG